MNFENSIKKGVKDQPLSFLKKDFEECPLSSLAVYASILAILVVSILILIDLPLKKRWFRYLNSEISGSGIVVHGYCTEGWVSNSLPSEPRIVKCVASNLGELTQWVKVLEPGEKIITRIAPEYGFHVLRMDGVEIDWLKPVLNGVNEVVPRQLFSRHLPISQ